LLNKCNSSDSILKIQINVKDKCNLAANIYNEITKKKNFYGKKQI